MGCLREKSNIILFAIVLVIGIVYTIDKVEANREIKETWVKEYLADKKSYKENIIEVVLHDAGYADWYDKKESIDLKIDTADLLGDDKKELVLTLSLGPQKSIIVVYESIKNAYKYIKTVDTFFDIKGIQAIPIKKQGKDILIVRESVDQMLGAFEKGHYIRGYIWNNGKFEMVLSIMEDYEAYWNEMWEQPPKSEAKWLRVMEKSTIMWENSPYPVLRVLEHQSYSKSKIVNSKPMPKEDEYEIVDSKEITQTYYWSNKYKHFVLGEGKDVKTGETVAIIEDLSQDPFELAGFKQDKYRIKKKDGKIEVVPKNQITNIKSPLKDIEDFFMKLFYCRSNIKPLSLKSLAYLRSEISIWLLIQLERKSKISNIAFC